MESTICCHTDFEGVDCSECEGFFCDHCYDCGLGDGCQCHTSICATSQYKSIAGFLR